MDSPLWWWCSCCCTIAGRKAFAGVVTCLVAIVVAVGWYEDKSRHYDAMVVTEVDGVWQEAKEVALPGNAAANQNAFLQSISCSAPRSCVATGDYIDSSGHQEGMVLTERNGAWSNASEITLPENARTR